MYINTYCCSSNLLLLSLKLSINQSPSQKEKIKKIASKISRFHLFKKNYERVSLKKGLYKGISADVYTQYILITTMVIKVTRYRDYHFSRDKVSSR